MSYQRRTRFTTIEIIVIASVLLTVLTLIYPLLSGTYVPGKPIEIPSGPQFVTKIDGCEYIVTDVGMTHKGNCRNHKQ